jgi:hypothetical protein
VRPNRDTIQEFVSIYWGKARISSVRISSVPAKIWTMELPKTFVVLLLHQPPKWYDLFLKNTNKYLVTLYIIPALPSVLTQSICIRTLNEHQGRGGTQSGKESHYAITYSPSRLAIWLSTSVDMSVPWKTTCRSDRSHVALNDTYVQRSDTWIWSKIYVCHSAKWKTVCFLR